MPIDDRRCFVMISSFTQKLESSMYRVMFHFCFALSLVVSLQDRTFSFVWQFLEKHLSTARCITSDETIRSCEDFFTKRGLTSVQGNTDSLARTHGAKHFFHPQTRMHCWWTLTHGFWELAEITMSTTTKLAIVHRVRHIRIPIPTNNIRFWSQDPSVIVTICPPNEQIKKIAAYATLCCISQLTRSHDSPVKTNRKAHDHAPTSSPSRRVLALPPTSQWECFASCFGNRSTCSLDRSTRNSHSHKNGTVKGHVIGTRTHTHHTTHWIFVLNIYSTYWGAEYWLVTNKAQRSTFKHQDIIKWETQPSRSSFMFLSGWRHRSQSWCIGTFASNHMASL